MLASITSPVADDIALMEESISRRCSFGIGLADRAAAKALGPGGKRLRSALFFLAARLLSGKGPAPQKGSLVSVAAAIELMHAASLLHDDVTDGASRRRGLPSANALLGDAGCVLTGDLLWCAASEAVLETGSIRLVQEFASAARSMATGQIMERERIHDAESYVSMIEAKSASLFSLAARAAALCTSAPPETERALRDYGLWTGIAFQIADDLMDREEDSASGTGRPLVELLGDERQALSVAREFAGRAASLAAGLADGGPESSSLVMLAEYAASRAG